MLQAFNEVYTHKCLQNLTIWQKEANVALNGINSLRFSTNLCQKEISCEQVLYARGLSEYSFHSRKAFCVQILNVYCSHIFLLEQVVMSYQQNELINTSYMCYVASFIILYLKV